jgi:cation transport ATPase
VSETGPDTAYGRIVEEVERAERSKAPVQKMADRLGCAALTFMLTRNIRDTISVVIVAGACGVAAGTPLAILGAIGRAARPGAIVKGGIHLEALAKVDTVVLDKTGTLTYGSAVVSGVKACVDGAENAVVEAAAIAERPSEHPLARAIEARSREMGIPPAEPQRFEYAPGKGIVRTYQGAKIVVGSRSFLEENRIFMRGCLSDAGTTSEVLVGKNGKLLGAIRFSDTLRPEAVRAVSDLRGMGMRTVMMTGDVAPIAREVGAELRVDEIHAGLLPHQKVEKLQQLLKAGLSPWSGMASTTPRHSLLRRSAWQWARARTSRESARTSCSWAAICPGWLGHCGSPEGAAGSSGSTSRARFSSIRRGCSWRRSVS